MLTEVLSRCSEFRGPMLYKSSMDSHFTLPFLNSVQLCYIILIEIEENERGIDMRDGVWDNDTTLS